ncbi:DUF4123 domain-containing protein [Providencia huaxiensis]|uniref:DUF4123 domain-containing protein n=1 Tax=Providencia TaxID=586 RepID=UPI001B386C18|nr:MULTISPECIES: DUF4123 domain-containing protein [Providencia]EJD6367871.1 DUF4123 domain-containing protein [Providencia rettgeri]EJD6371916.1 DUF4123 domain-containing protein [Providencia rettgeri]EJD6584605.1 DUF4123 domain-containing protein [Providencia rettgeri]EJD6613082.1 DUF4123 domain-containing protein [Providencia rettgeri]ELL9150863.1 DUF4123 domain-containing protein [Providencia rettgeri]
MNNIPNRVSNELVGAWLEKLRAISAQAQNTHIDIIIDQAGLSQSFIPALKMLGDDIKWLSLFTGMPEEVFIEDSPLLIRFKWDNGMHVIYLTEILAHYYHSSRILVAVSLLPFDSLAKFLQALVEIKWENRTGILRFYDPRIFPELIKHILNENEARYFSQLAYMWNWIDKDGEMRWLEGTFFIDVEKQTPPTLTLDINQLTKIGCISDAVRLMFLSDFENPHLTREENFDLLYTLTLQAYESDFIGNTDDYVLQHLPAFATATPKQ